MGLREMGRPYYRELAAGYRERRDVLVAGLQEAGFRCHPPQGAYYVLADFSDLSKEDDVTFARTLTRAARVAPVPGSSFFSEGSRGASLVRFAFCKRLETLQAAADRLRRFAAGGGG